MNKIEQVNTGDGRDAVEELLGKATPRPQPPAADAAKVRQAVEAEWRHLTRRRRMRRTLAGFGIAATVVLALALGIRELRVPEPVTMPVATIVKSFGSLYVGNAAAELNPAREAATVSVGQLIVTGNDSGAGLDWNRGGSLRIDRNTRLRIVSAESVFLESGRLYFDSAPSPLIRMSQNAYAPESGSALRIETRHGMVRHVGTQYMTSADRHRLAVSVREGRVHVSGSQYAATAVAGQQLTVSGNGRTGVANITGHGDTWQWIEATSPPASLDGRSVHDFLAWITRETGLRLEYESDAARTLAHSSDLRGVVQTRPTRALEIYAGSVDLDWRKQGGILYVSETLPQH